MKTIVKEKLDKEIGSYRRKFLRKLVWIFKKDKGYGIINI